MSSVNSRALLSGSTPLLAAAALVTLTALLGNAGDEAFNRTITDILVTVILVVGLYVFVGNSGVLSFGHIAFMAMGAYTTAWLTIDPVLKQATLPNLPGFLADAHVSAPVAVLAGGAVAAALAAVFAYPITRLSGIAASIATLSLLVIVNVVLSNWDNLTNGTGTIVGVPSDIDAMSALPWVLGVLVVAFVYGLSRRGSCLRATREDAVAAQSLGINVGRERSIAFVLSAFCVGCGGSLYAQYLGAFNPGQFYLDLTFLTIAMLIIGGMGSLSGAVVGTLAVSAISEVLSRAQADGIDIAGAHIQVRAGWREVILAALMLAILLFRPAGITGGREIRLFRPRVPRLPAVPGLESAENLQGSEVKR